MWKASAEKSDGSGKQSESSRGRQARGRPLPWAAQGGGVSKREVPRSGGVAAYREAVSLGYFAPQIPPLFGFGPAKVEATS